MNYIRGAVYAISAPYQYYKELPPLNPSTLTGAIDVIVVRRPTEDGGDVELVSSPFHVRFGKWQVLRPADKKVRTPEVNTKFLDRPANAPFRSISPSTESTSRSI
jgi:phosphatidate phosphatase PAH1